MNHDGCWLGTTLVCCEQGFLKHFIKDTLACGYKIKRNGWGIFAKQGTKILKILPCKETGWRDIGNYTA